MKIATSTICINPTFPIKQAGFIQQVNPIYNFHDDLHARILAFEDDHQIIYHVSLDLLELPIVIQDTLQKELQKKNNKKVIITLSCTHTHFGCDEFNKRYHEELISRILHAIEYLNYTESNSYEISYQCVPFDKLGTSRISNHKAIVLLQLYTIYYEHNPLIEIIVHNVHPTIHHGETPYFTSEYPGYVLQELKRKYPNIYFTFMQGAAGDTSTRFTRTRQDYEGVVELGNKLVEEVERLMNEDVEIKPFDQMIYESEILPLEHEFNPIDLSNLPSNLTPRELETIEIGSRVREELSHHLETLNKEVLISKLELGPYKFVFVPNEVFSCYIECVDISKCSLIAYSNGHSPYVTGLNDNFITYEKFTDTLTLDCKKELMALYSKYGK